MNNPGHILIIDDEPGMRSGCRRTLTAAGYAVEEAADAEQGLRRVRQGGLDLLLVDNRLPGMGGIELLERVQLVDPDVVSIVITGFATLETAIEATKRGAYDLLPKPFGADELLLVVGRGMERRQLALEARSLREARERDLLLLAEERSRLRAVLDSLADGVLVTNRQGRLALYNPAALCLLGLTEPPPAGVPLSEVLTDGALADLLTQEPVDRTCGPATIAREVARDGLTLLASMSPIMDGTGEQLGKVTLLRDISAAKALEEMKSQFVSMTSHELRTPLAAVQTYLETLLGGYAGALSEQQREILERCGERLAALLGLVDDLLDVTRMESGRIERRIVALNVAEVVHQVVELLRPMAEERRVSLNNEVPASLPVVEMDREDLTRVLTNLIGNAIKYNRPGGAVFLRGRSDEHHLYLEVQDTGLGMPKEALPRLGSEFFRVKRPETAAITGTGLGLSIVRRILDYYHGRWQVESELGQGTRFVIALPISPATASPWPAVPPA
ncbi:MAG: response regulator [Anaerolineae bacterium]